MIEHFIGVGPLKVAAKVANHLSGGAIDGVVKGLDEFTSSPAYTKHRIDQARETVRDFWNDHEDEVHDFLDNAGEAVGNAVDSVGDILGDAAGSLADVIGGLFS